jgi:RNA polymerase sigma-70 factor (ECF subfamily)
MPLIPPILAPASDQAAADRELVDLLVQGDWQAADRFVRLNQHLVMSVLRRFRMLPREEREDLFQRVFLKLFEDEFRVLRQWNRTTNFAAFLRKISRNVAIDEIRRQKGLPEIEDLEEADSDKADERADPEVIAVHTELRRKLLECLQRLPPGDQEILALIDLEGCSYKEAAERLGIPANRAGVRLHEARKRLRKVIEQHHPELVVLLNMLDR